MEKAYVTLLSSVDYLPAVLILNQNLKNVGSQYPLVVGVTDNITRWVCPYLESEGIKYHNIPFLEYCQEIKQEARKQNAPQWLNICSKFALFKLFDYKKLVYLDADIYIQQNIDNLFDYPDGALYDDCGTPFAGLMVFCPLYHYADFYKEISDKFGLLESEVIERLFFPFKTDNKYHIPFEYYVNITIPDLDKYNLAELKVIHFIYQNKPWLFLNAQDYCSTYPVEEMSILREQITTQYFEDYVYPLWEKYPKLIPQFEGTR